MKVLQSVMQESNRVTANRRRVIKGLSAGLAAATVPATVSARDEQVTGAAEIGIRTRVNELLANGETRRARQLLEKHGVPYTANEKKMPATGVDVETTDGVSDQDQWTKSESTLDHYSYLSSGDTDSGVFQSSMYWNLNKEGNSETDGPDDGAGITVNPDLWEVVLDSWEFDNRSSLDKRGSKGVIVKYNDPWQDDQYSDTTGYLRARFEKTEAGSHNLYGTYTHTWAPLGVPSGVSFSLAVGPIGVSASGATDTWSKRADNNE